MNENERELRTSKEWKKKKTCQAKITGDKIAKNEFKIKAACKRIRIKKMEGIKFSECLKTIAKKAKNKTKQNKNKKKNQIWVRRSKRSRIRLLTLLHRKQRKPIENFSLLLPLFFTFFMLWSTAFIMKTTLTLFSWNMVPLYHCSSIQWSQVVISAVQLANNLRRDVHHRWPTVISSDNACPVVVFKGLHIFRHNA